MLRPSANKGVVLIMVLATVLITFILTDIVLTIVKGHYDITHHKTSRIRSYYADMAAMNLAMDKLRRGEWSCRGDWAPWSKPFDCTPYYLCPTTNCPGSPADDIYDSDIPYVVTIQITRLHYPATEPPSYRIRATSSY